MSKKTDIRGCAALALVALLAAGPAAADLPADAKTLLRQVVTDPNSAILFKSTVQAKFEGDESGVTVTLPQLTIATKANPVGGLDVGDLVIHVHRRADGGIEAIVDVPAKMTFKGAPATPTTPETPDSLLSVTKGDLRVGWGADLKDSDQFSFSADSISSAAGDKPGTVLDKVAMQVKLTAPDGSAGNFALSLGGVEDANNTAPVSVKGVGPLEIQGHYDAFPRERIRMVSRHVMWWERARAARKDAAVNLGFPAQILALLEESGAHYVIDKFLLKTANQTVESKADIHFSLEAAHGFLGTLTAWLSEPEQKGQADPANPMAATGNQLAQFGEKGKAPDGSDARIFRIELAAGGRAKLNGEDAPKLATGMANMFQLFWVGITNLTAPKPAAGPTPTPPPPAAK